MFVLLKVYPGCSAIPSAVSSARYECKEIGRYEASRFLIPTSSKFVHVIVASLHFTKTIFLNLFAMFLMLFEVVFRPHLSLVASLNDSLNHNIKRLP